MTIVRTPRGKDAKGKEKEAASSLSQLDWNLLWEPVQALTDFIPQTLCWAHNNVIYYSHPVLPRVCARVIHPNPSTAPTHFELPIPPIDFSVYGPPTIISSAAQDAWIFAYFPSGLLNDNTDKGGLGCIWKCGTAIGNVSVVWSWPVKRGHAPVASRWVETRREWYLPPGQTRPRRGRPIGLRLSKAPTLLLVTQSNQIELIHRPEATRTAPAWRLLRAPLYAHWTTVAGTDPNTFPENLFTSDGGARICAKAAIGYTSDGESIIVATRSKLAPYMAPFATQSLGPLNLAEPSLPSAIAGSSTSDGTTWESWGEGDTISLCQVRINLGNEQTALETTPLPSIPTTSLPVALATTSSFPCSPSDLQITHLELINAPRIDSPYDRPDLTQDATMLNLDNGAMADEEGDLQLYASFVYLGNYMSPPRSVLARWRVRRKGLMDQGHVAVGSFDSEVSVADSDATEGEWTAQLVSCRAFDRNIISVMQSYPLLDNARLVVATIEHGGTVPSGQSYGTIGSLKVLKYNFADDTRYRDIALYEDRDRIGSLLPSCAALSPNRVFFATIPSHGCATTPAIVRCPSLKDLHTVTPTVKTESVDEVPASRPPHALFPNLALSIMQTCDPNDVFRDFWQFPGASVESAGHLLLDVWGILPVDTSNLKMKAPETAANGDKTEVANHEPPAEAERWNWTMVGLALGLYRACPNPEIGERWTVAHHLIRLMSAREAFIELSQSLSLRDSPISNDSQPLNRLISISARYIELVSSVIREAIIWEGWRACYDQTEDDPGAPQPANVLLLLLHPHSVALLRDVLVGTRALHNHLTRTNNPLRRTAVNITEASGIDLAILQKTLEDIRELVFKALKDIPDSRALSRCLTYSLSVPAQLRPILNTCTQTINQRAGLADKMTLLIPSLNYPDVQATSEQTKRKTRVRYQVPLPTVPQATITVPSNRVCLRCGEEGETRLHELMSFTFWGAYERNTRRFCTCGGRWMVVTAH
ncbi:hypothetical protein FRB99_008862 [Tulasnella sp. 403]|nr:hypothetical protein FRB99_008862 [Tulasnella sp. 403]